MKMEGILPKPRPGYDFPKPSAIGVRAFPGNHRALFLFKDSFSKSKCVCVVSFFFIFIYFFLFGRQETTN